MDNEKEFNILERAVLDWMIENNKDSNAIIQLKAARLTSREWTKVGFFVNLDVPKSLAPIGSVTERTIINGPQIESEDIEFSATSLIFTKDGYLDFLEMSAAGNFFRENVINFKLLADPSALNQAAKIFS